MKAVFLDHATIDSGIALSMLQAAVDELQVFDFTKQQDILHRAFNAEIIITNKVELDESCLRKLTNLKLVCVTATGTNNIDLQAAQELSIAVTNVANYSTTSVAQHVFSFLLSITNSTAFYQQLNQTHPWYKSKTFCQISSPIDELAGKKIGIFVYGDIGKAVANIATAFGMEIIVSERPDAESTRQGRVPFQQMLATCDVISLHCPLTDDTNNLFDKVVFEQVKAGCILINTARGAIVNSEDLASALCNGHLGYAIIDVLETEPPAKTHPLVNNSIPNLILTHHIAWGSLQAQQRLIDGVVENIKAYRQNKKLNRV